MREFEIKDSDIQIIFKLISRLVKKEISSLPVDLRKNPTVLHYYNEIIRFWNKINFVVKKTLRGSDSLKARTFSKYLYVTYRILWESATEKEIINEIINLDKKFLHQLKSFSWKKALIKKDDVEKLSILESIPSFMIKHLLPIMKMDFLKENIKFMNRDVDDIEITIRVNNLHRKTSTEDFYKQIIEGLSKDQIEYRRDSDIPEMFWIPLCQKIKVLSNYFYQKGFLLFQDKASGTVIKTLSPREEDQICDMCAAPGIKTSLIAQSMNNKGHIIAGDFLHERIKMMKRLLKQLNVSNVNLINTDSIIFPIRFQNYFDKILLDAPCTGSGNLLANPELKLRQNKKFLRQNIILQRKLIKSALDLLKPNGIFVYSTCSIYPEEGELQILNFIDSLEPLDLPKWISPSYRINNKTIPGTGRLFPSIHQTQGFFIAKFKKK
ncbi:MAG: RsmB/NOP family class I SAM-dependent RNA methyltransferase [Promethearchaeota archaeon]